MLSQKIKEETKNNHQILEKSLVAFIRSIRTKDDYSKLLSLFYGFFGGLEIRIDACIDHSHLPDYSLRRKTSALAEDFVQLEAPLPALAVAAQLPIITDHLQALGALYVIEGSTLGGKIIAKMIFQQLGLSENTGLSFFNGYGDDTENMWKTFKHALDRPLTSDEEIIVIGSANQTFKKFGDWFNYHLD